TLPMLGSNNSRLLRQIFRGGMLVSNDLEPLRISLLRVNAVKQRNSTDFESLTAFGYAPVSADHYDYLALDYQALPGLSLSYHLSDLDDLYLSLFLGLLLDQPRRPGSPLSDIL